MKPAIFVPVKGSSERIPSKNLKLLDGKPLFLHTLEKLSFHHEFFDVFLDTESEEVIKLSSHLESINILRRDPALATNKTDGNKLFMNEVKACSDNAGYCQQFGSCEHLNHLKDASGWHSEEVTYLLDIESVCKASYIARHGALADLVYF